MSSSSDFDGLPEEQLAEKAGAFRASNRTKAGNSVPLHPRIEGRRAYLSKLPQAARELYDRLRQDEKLQALSSSREKIVLDGKPRGTLPAFPRRPDPRVLTALEHILHSCAFVASNPMVSNKEGRLVRYEYVAVPMDRNAFVSGQEYEHLSFQAFSGMVLALASFAPDGERWLEYVPPFKDRQTGQGKRTRIAPTEGFRDWMLRQGLIFPFHPKGRKSRPAKAQQSLLWISTDPDQEGSLPDKTASPLDRPLLGDEMILPALNDRLARQRLACPVSDYRTYESHYDFKEGRSRLRQSGSQRLYRQFVGEDGRGGRLYGHWAQSVPSALRPRLTINGQPTAELDYASMQLVLLYAMKGVPVPEGDLYAIAGFERRRERMKAVLTRSVGVGSRVEALRSIRKYLRENNALREGLDEKLYDAFWQHHRAVYPHGEGAEPMWSKLQFADSQIALRVLRYLLEEGIAAIPIHDSFIVQERHRESLSAAMARGFASFWPDTKIRIKPDA